MSGRQNNGCQNIQFLFLFCTFYEIGLITWGQVTVVAYLGLGCLIMINVFELDGDSIQSGLGRMHFFFCQDHRYMVLVAAAHVGANQFCANHNQQSTITINNFVRITISRRRTVCKPPCAGCQPETNKFDFVCFCNSLN